LASKAQRAPALYGIVAFKLIRGVLLLSLALGVYTLVGDDLREAFERALRVIRVDPETEFFNHLGDRIAAITPTNVRWVATGTLLYGLLSIGEGIGLAWRLGWPNRPSSSRSRRSRCCGGRAGRSA
jgi:uncharacterized membrane protein (DUF2068 family)